MNEIKTFLDLKNDASYRAWMRKKIASESQSIVVQRFPVNTHWDAYDIPTCMRRLQGLAMLKAELEMLARDQNLSMLLKKQAS